MTPGDLGQLATTFGPTTAILLVMWLNRNPTKEDKKADPLAALSARMERMENLLTRIDAKMDGHK